MDPISMVFAFAMQNPSASERLVSNYVKPGEVQVAQMNESAVDFAMQALACYHKSARFRDVNIIGTNWRSQSKFNADASVVMRISFEGVSGTSYQMDIAAMAKQGAYRTFVIGENTIIPYNKKCALENWVLVDNFGSNVITR